jgi:hypothetical protein
MKTSKIFFHKLKYSSFEEAHQADGNGFIKTIEITNE